MTENPKLKTREVNQAHLQETECFSGLISRQHLQLMQVRKAKSWKIRTELSRDAKEKTKAWSEQKKASKLRSHSFQKVRQFEVSQNKVKNQDQRNQTSKRLEVKNSWSWRWSKSKQNIREMKASQTTVVSISEKNSSKRSWSIEFVKKSGEIACRRPNRRKSLPSTNFTKWNDVDLLPYHYAPMWTIQGEGQAVWSGSRLEDTITESSDEIKP